MDRVFGRLEDLWKTERRCGEVWRIDSVQSALSLGIRFTDEGGSAGRQECPCELVDWLILNCT